MPTLTKTMTCGLTLCCAAAVKGVDGPVKPGHDRKTKRRPRAPEMSSSGLTRGPTPAQGLSQGPSRQSPLSSRNALLRLHFGKP